jgi:RHS repeat-associated protein
LVAVNYTGFTTRSEFTYDGQSRMVKIVEKTGATINSTRKFVWYGQEKVEFRDAADAVTQRNYKQGQYVGTTVYFYTRDHLGSIREMFTGGGTVVARYDYDPYGRSTTVLGTTPTDFNFTGLYRHSKSNLDLAVYRAYDPDLGRWLNRDPIEEKGGLNLYGYVGNRTIKRYDSLGLTPAAATAALASGVILLGGEEAGGWVFGGNFNPVVDVVIGGTAIGVGVWALWEYLQPEAPLPNHADAQAKPKNCPSGTVPIDTPEGRKRLPPGVKPHDAKGEVGGRPTDWTGVDPEGNIITSGPDGEAINHGPPSANPSK